MYRKIKLSKKCTTIKRCAAGKKVVHRFPDSCAVRRAQPFIVVHGGKCQDSSRTTPAHSFSAHNLSTHAHNCAQPCAQGPRTRLRTTLRTTLHSLVRTTPEHKADPCAHNVFLFHTILYYDLALFSVLVEVCFSFILVFSSYYV